MAFKDRLKEARLSNGLTQEQVAEKIGVAKSTFTGYEKGNSEPNMYTISQIMKALNVDANYLWQDEMDALGGNPIQLKYNEMEHIKKYRNLDDHGKETVDIILDRETTRVTALSKLENSVKDMQTVLKKTPAAMRIYTYLHKIAAAGTGFYFEDIPTDTIEAPFCENADFIIGVSGDSMEPTYNDGDLVYVEKCQIVHTGDVGIFIVNNEIYIKEAGENGLISHNSKYDPIPGSEDILCVGKVLKKVNVD